LPHSIVEKRIWLEREKLMPQKMLKNVIKFFLPNVIIVLYRQYNKFLKHKKKNQNIQKKFIFDIILSVGDACRPAYYLKKHDLRFYANPLDWMMSYSLDTVIHLYKTKFNDFFVDFVEDKQKSLEYNCHWYIDNKNNIISMHYKDIESNNRMFRDKMVARFDKINNILLNANKICFISNRSESIDVYKSFLEKMSKIYFGNMTYINIRNHEDIDAISPTFNHYKEKMSDKLELIEYEFNDIHPQGNDLKINDDVWIGNYTFWDNIMKGISVKYKLLSFLSFWKNRNID
jgi:hypothetical protein